MCEGYEFGASYPDSICIDGRLFDADKCHDGGSLHEPTEYIPCPMCHEEKAIAYWKTRFDLVTSLLAFALEDTPETRALSTLAAGGCDNIPRDYFGEETDFATDFDSVLKKLGQRDLIA